MLILSVLYIYTSETLFLLCVELYCKSIKNRVALCVPRCCTLRCYLNYADGRHHLYNGLAIIHLPPTRLITHPQGWHSIRNVSLKRLRPSRAPTSSGMTLNTECQSKETPPIPGPPPPRGWHSIWNFSQKRLGPSRAPAPSGMTLNTECQSKETPHDQTPGCHPVSWTWMRGWPHNWMKLCEPLMCLAYSFEMLHIDICTTRHWQTTGWLVQELNVCTVHPPRPFRFHPLWIDGTEGNCKYVTVRTAPSCGIFVN